MKTVRKNTKAYISEIVVPWFGYPRIRVVTPTLGIVSITGKNILKYGNLGDDVIVSYTQHYSLDNTFIKNIVNSITLGSHKLENIKATIHKV